MLYLDDQSNNEKSLFCLESIDDLSYFYFTLYSDFFRSGAEFKCPECNEVLIKQHVFSDKVALREVSDLLCYCPNETRGCSWRGELRDAEVRLINVWAIEGISLFLLESKHSNLL